MAKQSPAQKEVVERVMHEFKEGELKRNDGETVTNPKQAIAIALREAGSSDRASPAENRKALARTKRKERSGGAAKGRAGAGETKAALYARAKDAGIKGRSRMSADELRRALGR